MAALSGRPVAFSLGIRGLGMPGVSAYPGDGRPIVTVPGLTSTPTVGFGSRAAAGWDLTRSEPTLPSFSVLRPPATRVGPCRRIRIAPAGPVRQIQCGGSSSRSAGLGVARGSVRNLGKVSQQMERASLPRGPLCMSAVRMPPQAEPCRSFVEAILQCTAAPSGAAAPTSSPRMSGGGRALGSQPAASPASEAR